MMGGQYMYMFKKIFQLFCDRNQYIWMEEAIDLPQVADKLLLHKVILGISHL
jgi:hypothetical protein